jgi:tRNA G26 N,N-dimethylase Trm1
MVFVPFFPAEELPDVPFYYQLDRLCSLMKVTVGKFVDFRSAILNAGFRVSISHANKQAIKTDAPIEVRSIARIFKVVFPEAVFQLTATYVG